MKGELGDRVRLVHILDAIDEVEKYLDNISYEEYQNISEKKFATVKQIEIIGEACNALSEGLKQSNPEIPWKSIRGLRNISVHEYFGVDFHLIWEVATIDLPSLKVKIENILKNLEPGKL